MRSSTSLWRLSAALISVAAGCVGGDPAGPFSPPEADSAASGSGDARVPAWDADASWSYTVRDAAGSELGKATLTVHGTATILGVEAYAVEQVTHLRESRANQTMYYDVENLNLVWDDCIGEPAAECSGRFPELDFPLADGKEWSARMPGPLPQTFSFAAERTSAADGHEVWTVTETPSLGGDAQRVLVYDPAQRLVVEIRELDAGGNVTSTWVLEGTDEATS